MANAIAPHAPSNEDMRSVVSDGVKRLGLREAASRLGLTTETVARVLGGLDIRNGSRALMVANLHKLTDEAR